MDKSQQLAIIISEKDKKIQELEQELILTQNAAKLNSLMSDSLFKTINEVKHTINARMESLDKTSSEYAFFEEILNMMSLSM